jgi:hypothetical protein
MTTARALTRSPLDNCNVKLPAPSVCALNALTSSGIAPNGAFATAAHVAMEAEKLLAKEPGTVGIAHTIPDGRTLFLPIWKFFVHPTADVAFGVPRSEFVNDRTGDAYRAKVLCLTRRSAGRIDGKKPS